MITLEINDTYLLIQNKDVDFPDHFGRDELFWDIQIHPGPVLYLFSNYLNPG